MKNILITGGAGYLGNSLVLELLKNSRIEKIVVYDNLSRSNYNIFTSGYFSKDDRLIFVKGDILDQRCLNRSLIDIDTVFHLAAKVGEPYRDIDSQQFDQVNNWGTSVLANEVLKSNVENFVYVSSVYVYGTSESSVNVHSEPTPNSFYGVSKLKGERQSAAILSNELKLYTLRIGNLYGYNPAIRYDVIINKLLFDAYYLGLINIYGDGHQVRPFLEVNECARIMIEVIDSNSNPGVYNIVEKNLEIVQVVSMLKNSILELDHRYINRNVKMNNIIVENSNSLNKYFNNEITFEQKVETLLSKF